MEFYDTKMRPNQCDDYTDEELDRICLNCGKCFGEHFGYNCPEQI